MKHVTHVDERTFDQEVLGADVAVLVDFGAAWCPPCRALEPIVDAIAHESDGRYKVVAVDIDDAPDIAKRYGIRGAPTLLVFRNGERRAAHIGLASREKVLSLLKKGSTIFRQNPK